MAGPERAALLLFSAERKEGRVGVDALPAALPSRPAAWLWGSRALPCPALPELGAGFWDPLLTSHPPSGLREGFQKGCSEGQPGASHCDGRELGFPWVCVFPITILRTPGSTEKLQTENSLD